MSRVSYRRRLQFPASRGGGSFSALRGGGLGGGLDCFAYVGASWPLEVSLPRPIGIPEQFCPGLFFGRNVPSGIPNGWSFGTLESVHRGVGKLVSGEVQFASELAGASAELALY